jgi:hypothetical protein
MDVNRIQAELDGLYQDASLYDEANLEGRADALDRIALIQETISVQCGSRRLGALAQRAQALQGRLEEIDRRYFDRLLSAIRSDECTPGYLRREFDRAVRYSSPERGRIRIGYDGLDVLVHGLFLTEPVPRETRARTQEMVQYEATPARVALDLVDRIAFGPEDVFYDLGSGLGHIVLLVHLLTGVPAKGVEFEPAFCEYARRCAGRLCLSGASFLNVDARHADYADGTVFFMFTPFTGTMLEAVLGRLRDEARDRPVKVCTYGKCTFAVAGQPWLRSADKEADSEFRLGVFSSE